jgi:hypothetical protein
MIQTKRYCVSWRHRTRDTPDYPYHGAGFAWGRTKREALRNYFGRWRYSAGDTSYCSALEDAFRRGELEITEMRRG